MKGFQSPFSARLDFDGDSVFFMLNQKIHLRRSLAFFADPKNRFLMSLRVGQDQLLPDDHLGDLAAVERMQVGVLKIMALQTCRKIDQPDIEELEFGRFFVVRNQGNICNTVNGVFIPFCMIV